MIDPVENDLYRYERALDKEYAFDHAVEMPALDLFKEYKRLKLIKQSVPKPLHADETMDENRTA